MSDKDNGANAGLKIGRTLELARKEQGLSLHQVEQETKIRTRYLRELERENFDVLPAVYVQGSLKTYASFLGLDGEALTRELRRRQPPEEEPEAPTHVEPPKSEYLDRYLVTLGAAGAESRQMSGDEDGAGAAVPAGDNNRLYLVSGAFLVLVLVAIALMVTLARDSQPVVSEVREPLISQAPSEVSRAGGEENEPSYRLEDDESGNPGPEKRAGSPGEDARDEDEPAQGTRDATASASASPATETATAEPDATPEPTTEEPAPAPARPAPADPESPGQEGQGAVGGVRVGGPVQKDNGGPVKGFSITRERNAPAGGASSPGGSRASGSCSRDGGGMQIRQGKKSVGICLTGNRVGGKDNDRELIP